MTQLWALTVDSSWLPRDPMLRERGGMRQTRWDVITPCNLEEIHWAALSQDESIPLILSLYSHQVPLLARSLIKGSENQFCLVGVPQGLVLGPAQISYSPGAMFFPQGVAPQTDSQTAHPMAQAQPASTQLSWDPPQWKGSLVELMLRALLISGCLSVFLSDTSPFHLILSHFPPTAQSEARGNAF